MKFKEFECVNTCMIFMLKISTLCNLQGIHFNMQALIRQNYFLNYFIKREGKIVKIFPYTTHATL